MNDSEPEERKARGKEIRYIALAESNQKKKKKFMALGIGIGNNSESERDLKGISHRTQDPFYMGVVKEREQSRKITLFLLGQLFA